MNLFNATRSASKAAQVAILHLAHLAQGVHIVQGHLVVRISRCKMVIRVQSGVI